jgi:protocatechuate 3,4-dioxygenase, beta subunit
MEFYTRQFSRRNFLATLGTTASMFVASSVFAEEMARFVNDGDFAQELIRTPYQTEGPFYPDHLPLDQDNDLVLIKNGITPAVGVITHLSGKLLDLSGKPISGAKIEIWQVDNNGAYIHSQSSNRDKLDKNFQGYGKFETSKEGEYRFRTIRPVAYPGRTPHIHMKVTKGDRELLTTQSYIKGDPRNDRDGVILAVKEQRLRDALMATYEPMKESKVGELKATFNIVVGRTPEDRH